MAEGALGAVRARLPIRKPPAHSLRRCKSCLLLFGRSLGCFVQVAAIISELTRSIPGEGMASSLGLWGGFDCCFHGCSFTCNSDPELIDHWESEHYPCCDALVKAVDKFEFFGTRTEKIFSVPSTGNNNFRNHLNGK